MPVAAFDAELRASCRAYPLLMDARFWDLLDSARPANGEPSAHADAIRDALVTEGAEATVTWGTAFDRAVDALDHWDLWGALYLGLGGCSDDAYLYARCWVVGRGRVDWERARADPEGFVVDLVTDARVLGDPISGLDGLGLFEGEHLLYAAGRAHEQLTGVWLPRDSESPDADQRPRGERWEEDDLAVRFPSLAAVVPGEWLDTGSKQGDLERATALFDLSQLLDAGCAAFEAGDHVVAVELLGRILDDPAAWELAGAIEELRTTAAYVGGMCRFILGDTDGASAWLRKALDQPRVPPHVRRGLAQIELARGELDAADQLLDRQGDAAPLDRALTAVVALRRGDVGAARAIAADLSRDLELPSDAHPWDLAGIHVQLGFVALELPDADGAESAAEAVSRLAAGAPREVPLLPQGEIVLAGALRLRGEHDKARTILSPLSDELRAGTCDRGLAERESARCARAAGDETEGARLYVAAAATFRAAGERWYAESTEAEAQLGLGPKS